MSKNEKEKSKRPQHTGSVAPEDATLSTWLHKLWHQGEPPQRIEVYQLFGRKNYARGEMIFHEDFKANEKLDVEQANKLANDIIEAAQHDCDCTPGAAEMSYQLVVKDNNRTATPLTRRLGPIPKKRVTIARPGEGDDEDEEDALLLNGKSLSLAYLKNAFGQVQWERGRNDAIVGDAILILKERGDRAEERLERMMDRVMTLFDKNQEYADRSLDREVVREKEKFKISLWRDGARSLRNLLPGLFAAAREDMAGAKELPAGKNGNGNGNGTNGAPDAAPKDYGPSPERILVDNFLSDIEENKIDIALFGDHDLRDGKVVTLTPGVFSLDQTRILVGVREGKLPADELDKLIPKKSSESKSGFEVTEEQIIQAGDAGVTDGMGMALLEIINLRRGKQLSAQPDATAAQTTSEGP